MASHGNPSGHGGIWKACTESSACFEVKDGGTDWYFNVGAKSHMEPAYYAYADRNWPAIQKESEGKPWAPYCFNTNLIA